jgi:hypothetical protein
MRQTHRALLPPPPAAASRPGSFAGSLLAIWVKSVRSFGLVLRQSGQPNYVSPSDGSSIAAWTCSLRYCQARGYRRRSRSRGTWLTGRRPSLRERILERERVERLAEIMAQETDDAKKPGDSADCCSSTTGWRA